LNGSDDRRLIAGVALAALAVRLTAWSGAFAIGTDSAAFLRMAELIRGGRWHDALTTYYHPGYPAAVAAFSPVLGGIEAAGFLVSVLFGALSVVPLFLLTRDLFGRAAAILAGVLYSVHGFVVELHADVMTEGLYCAALFGAIWMGRQFLDRRRLYWAILAGVASAAAYLVRHEGLIAICGLTCWFLVEGFRRRKEARMGDCLLGLVFMAGAFLILSAPFLVWVRTEVGHWATTAKGSGIPLRRLLEGNVATVKGNLVVKALHSFQRLNYGILLVPLVAGLAWAWKLERPRRLFLLSWPAAYAIGVGYTMQGMGYVSYRYLVPVVCLLLPFIAWGLLRLLDRRPAVAIGATVVLVLYTGHKSFDWSRQEDVPLVRAGEWIRDREKARPKIMTTRDKVAWYAHGDIEPAPKNVDEAATADYIVLTRRDFDALEWKCLPDIAKDRRFERVAGDFTTPGRKSEEPVVLYRVLH
jgi:hypothetical protein